MGLKAPQFTLFGFVQGDRAIPGIIALSLNSGAYVSEIIRAGIQGIDYGQTEAARSLGMTAAQNMRYIVLPQAIKNILPAIANEFVTIIKESSICSVLGMQELMYNAKLVQGASFLPAEPLVIVTILYLCLTVPTSKVIQYFERRMSRGDQAVISSRSKIFASPLPATRSMLSTMSAWISIKGMWWSSSVLPVPANPPFCGA